MFADIVDDMVNDVAEMVLSFMWFCRSFGDELAQYLGDEVDVLKCCSFLMRSDIALKEDLTIGALLSS